MVHPTLLFECQVGLTQPCPTLLCTIDNLFHPTFLFVVCLSHLTVFSMLHPTLTFSVCFTLPYCLQCVSPYSTVFSMFHPTIPLAVCFTLPYCSQYISSHPSVSVCSMFHPFTLPNCLQYVSPHTTVCIYFITPYCVVQTDPNIPSCQSVVQCGQTLSPSYAVFAHIII